MGDKKEKQNSEERLSFEAAVARLEKIVETLESGDAPLDTSLELFEEGVKLSRACNQRLEEIERKIEILTGRTDADGNPEAEPFDEAAID